MTGRSGRGVALVAALALASSCAPERRASTDEAGRPVQQNPLEAAPVDTARVASAADAAAWPHRRTTEADLDGDGRNETVHLAADVTLSDRGEPLWEDGHRWAVWVDDPATPTLLYAAFVPNGHVSAAIVVRNPDGTRDVLVEESTPDGSRKLVIGYRGPGQARLVSQWGDSVDVDFAVEHRLDLR